jgi:hypothetical protein
MRRPLTLSALAAAGLLASVQASAAPPPDQPLRTPDKAAQASNGVAAAGPMYDMNLYRQTIPPVLLKVMDDPYAKPPSSTCRALTAQIADLNAALGDDYDTAAAPDDSRSARRTRMARSGLRAGSEALLPFSGLVRVVSGAAKHDQRVLDAVMAGQARRAYLKGLGEARGCPTPARPLHAARTPPADERADLGR